MERRREIQAGSRASSAMQSGGGRIGQRSMRDGPLRRSGRARSHRRQALIAILAAAMFVTSTLPLLDFSARENGVVDPLPLLPNKDLRLLSGEPTDPFESPSGSPIGPGSATGVFGYAGESPRAITSPFDEVRMSQDDEGTHYFVDGASYLAPAGSEHMLALTAGSALSIIAASTIVPAATGVAVEVEDVTLDEATDQDTLVVTYEAKVSGNDAGTMTLTTDFYKDAPAKQTAVFEPVSQGPLENAWLAWKTIPDFHFMKESNDIEETATVDLSSYAQLTQYTWSDDFLELGDDSELDQWRSNARVDWTDEGGGTLYIGPVEIDSSIQGPGVEVRFQAGDHEIDPSLGTSSTLRALDYQTQRKSFYYGGDYWIWWDEGGSISYATDRGGDSLHTAVQANDASFDVHLRGDTVVLSWIDGSADKAYVRVGRLGSGVVSKWWNTVVVDSSAQGELMTPPSGVVTTDGYVWMGLVSKVNGQGDYYFRIYKSQAPLDLDASQTDSGLTFSEDRRITFESTGPPALGNRDDAIQLVARSDGALTVVMTSQDRSDGAQDDLRWINYDPPSGWDVTGSNEPHSKDDILGNSGITGRFWSAVRTQADEVGVAFVPATWPYLVQYMVIDGSSGTTPVSVGTSGTAGYPSLGRDLNGRLHCIWLRLSDGYYYIEHASYSSVTGWSGPETLWDPLFRTLSDQYASTHLPELVRPDMPVVFRVNKGGSGHEIHFAEALLPTSIAPYGPLAWGGDGLQPKGKYIGEKGYVANLNTGVLQYRAMDFDIPGRALDLSFPRIFEGTRYFDENNEPIVDVGNPYTDLGPGWVLDFAWLSDTYFHMPGGDRVPLAFDGEGRFEWKGAMPFVADLDVSSGSSTVTATFANGVVMRFAKVNPAKPALLLEWMADNPTRTASNKITFSYNMSGSDQYKLRSIGDPTGRTIYLNYAGSGRMTSIQYAATVGIATQIHYQYDALGTLSNVVDRLQNSEQYTYIQDGNLLESIVFKEGGKATFSYVSQRVQVGANAYGYPVTGMALYSIHRSLTGFAPVRSSAIDYQWADGVLVQTLVRNGPDSASVINQHEEVAHPIRGYRANNVFDETGTLTSTTLAWGGPAGGHVSRIETYLPGEIAPSTIQYSMTDDWQNPVYSRDPYGFEAFSSYLNTNSQGSFESGARFDSIQTGLVVLDRFDSWKTPGWTRDDSCDDDCVAPTGLFDPPSLRLAATDSDPVHYATRTFDPIEDGWFFVVARAPETSGTLAHIRLRNLNDENDQKIGISFDPSGHIKRQTETAWASVYDTTPGEWYRIGIATDGSAATYALWINGELIDADFPFASGAGTQTINNVRLSVTEESSSGQFHVNEVAVSQLASGGLPQLSITNLPEGSRVLLLDPLESPGCDPSQEGSFCDFQKEESGSVSFSLTKGYSGTVRLVVEAVNRETLADMSVMVGGNTEFLFVPPADLSGLFRLESGFGRAETVVLDEGFCPSGATCEGFGDPDDTIVVEDEAVAVSGSEFHYSPFLDGAHSHRYVESTSTPAPGEGGYFIQYILIPSDSIPSQIGMAWHRIASGYEDSWRPASWNPPSRTSEWVMLVQDVSTLGFSGSETFDGIEFSLIGGSALWDFTAIGDEFTGGIRVSGLAEDQRVILRDVDGNELAQADADESGLAFVDAYSEGVRQFPIEASLAVLASGSTTIVEYSRHFERLWGGDLLHYEAQDFYPNNNVPEEMHNLLAGTTSWDEGREAISLDMETRLLDASDRLVDFSGNSHVIQVGGSPASATGVAGEAYDFDGSEDYLEVPPTDLWRSHDEFTLAMWVKPTTITSSDEVQILASIGHPLYSASIAIELRKPSSSGCVRISVWMDFDAAGVKNLYSGDLPSPCDWHHVAVSYDSHAVVLYVDGESVSQGPVERDSLVEPTYCGSLWIGKGFPATTACDGTSGEWAEYLDGTVDEVRAYTHGLSEEKVAQLFALERNPARKTYFLYDTAGSLVESKTETLADGWSAVEWLKKYWEYNSYGQPTSETSHVLQETTYTYTPSGSNYIASVSSAVGGLTSTTSYDIDLDNGNVDAAHSTGGNKTSYGYDELNRLVSVQYPTEIGVGAGQSETWEYDDDAKTKAFVAQSGWKTVSQYDGIGRVLWEHRYYPDDTYYSSHFFQYSFTDQIVELEDPETHHFGFGYDSMGRITSKSGPSQFAESVTYSQTNGRTRHTDAEGLATDRYSDLMGRLVKVCQWTSGSPDDCVPGSTYAIIAETEYDLAGQVTHIREGAGNWRTFSYDQTGMMTRASYLWYGDVYPGQTAQMYSRSYDTTSHQTTVSRFDGYGSETKTTLDGFGRPIAIDYPGGDNEDVEIEYDAEGRLGVTSNGWFAYIFHYNAWDLPTSKDIVYGIESPPGTTKSFSFAYDEFQRLTDLTYPDSTQVSYDFDDFDRVSDIASTWGFAVSDITFDRRDLLTERTDGTAPQPTGSYTYDGFRRLTQVDVETAPSSTTYDFTYFLNGDVKTDTGELYTYDGLHRLISSNGQGMGAAWGFQVFTYDENGNRVQLQTSSATTTYQYEFGDLIGSVCLPSPSCTTYSATFDHDENGLLTLISENGGASAYEYYYDDARRLSEVLYYPSDQTSQNPPDPVSKGQYWYGPDGELLKLTEDGTTRYYSPLGGAAIYGWDSDSGSFDHIMLGSMIVGLRVDGEDPFYAYQDQGQNVRLIVNQGMSAVWQYDYEPFGGAWEVGTSTINNDFGMAANNERDAIHLSFFHARWYSAALGRFISRDPVEVAPDFTQRTNLYTYSMDNPKTWVDRSGAFFGLHILVGGALGAIAGGVVYAVTHPMDEWTWEGGLGAVAAGALGGAITAACLGTCAAAVTSVMGVGAVAGVASEVVSASMEGRPITPEGLVMSAAIGAVTAGAAAAAGNALKNAGRALVNGIRGSGDDLAGAAASNSARGATANSIRPVAGRGTPNEIAAGQLDDVGQLNAPLRAHFQPIKPGTSGGPTSGRPFPQSIRSQAFDENPAGTCVYCHRPTGNPQVDHAIPRSLGGDATLENAQLACAWCNPSKGNGMYPKNPPPGWSDPWPPAWW